MDAITDPYHRMPPGYDCEDTSIPDFAAINKARDALIELVSRQCGDDEGRLGWVCGEWIAALEGLPSLEAAHEDDMLDGGRVMSAHTQPPTIPLHIDMGGDADFLRRTVEIEVDADEVRVIDITVDLDGGDLGRMYCITFPTLDDAERVGLRLLAAVRAAKVVGA